MFTHVFKPVFASGSEYTFVFTLQLVWHWFDTAFTPHVLDSLVIFLQSLYLRLALFSTSDEPLSPKFFRNHFENMLVSYGTFQFHLGVIVAPYRNQYLYLIRPPSNPSPFRLHLVTRQRSTWWCRKVYAWAVTACMLTHLTPTHWSSFGPVCVQTCTDPANFIALRERSEFGCETTSRGGLVNPGYFQVRCGLVCVSVNTTGADPVPIWIQYRINCMCEHGITHWCNRHCNNKWNLTNRDILQSNIIIAAWLELRMRLLSIDVYHNRRESTLFSIRTCCITIT